ncbi:MAG: NAD-dependent epimerase/dehydratase family protein, partial [Candidatus Zixiibacteriota bacterium]
KTLEVYGEEFWRPYCHTTDLACACITALEAEQAKVTHQAFNVGANNENYQKKTLVKMILNELPEMKDKVHYVYRDEDPRDYRVNFDKIKNTLGFTNTKKVFDGIRELIFVIKSGLIKNPDDRNYYNI